MKRRLMVVLSLGMVCVIAGLVLALMGVKPGIVPAVMVAIGGGCVGGWAIVFISTKGGTLVKDEMVVRIETLSGNYAFIASLWFIIVLGCVNIFYSLPWSVPDLLLAMMVFMSLSYLLFRWILMKRGKAE